MIKATATCSPSSREKKISAETADFFVDAAMLLKIRGVFQFFTSDYLEAPPPDGYRGYIVNMDITR